MATLHSGYEPESSVASAARGNSEFIELDSRNHPCGEATNNTPAQPYTLNAEAALATNELAHATAVSILRRTSIHDSNIELNAIHPHHNEAGATEAVSPLPPVDTGKDAWLFLFSAFVMDILVWGTSLTTHGRSAFALTPARFPLRLWHLPGILLLAPTLRGGATHCHRRYLRFRTHVPLFAIGLWHTCLVSHV
jgi:hypothetical protein